MIETYNGMPATELDVASWSKSLRSSSQGNCVELAPLPTGEVAVRNSRDPQGPALIYTPPEIEAFILGAKDGDFDHLLTRAAPADVVLPFDCHVEVGWPAHREV